MAVRDVVEYYNKVEEQYGELLEDIKDYEKALASNEITEEQYNQALGMIDAIKANYERLSYVMFLLKKRKKYLRKAKVEAAEIAENSEALNGLRRKDCPHG